MEKAKVRQDSEAVGSSGSLSFSWELGTRKHGCTEKDGFLNKIPNKYLKTYCREMLIRTQSMGRTQDASEMSNEVNFIYKL